MVGFTNQLLRFCSYYVKNWFCDCIGSGILNWVEAQATSTEIRLGDVYRLRPGTVFYLQSKPVDIFLGTKLKIYAIFSNSQECLHVRYDSFSFSYCIYIVYISFFLFVDRLPWMQDPCFGAYSSVTDLLFGFDETILKSAFGVRTHVICLCLGFYMYYV